jgi:hypothetical protein
MRRYRDEYVGDRISPTDGNMPQSLEEEEAGRRGFMSIKRMSETARDADALSDLCHYPKRAAIVIGRHTGFAAARRA